MRSVGVCLAGCVQAERVFLSPYHQGPADIFWAVVDRYGLGFAAPRDDIVQAPDDAFRGQRKVHVNAQAFTIKVVQDVQSADRPAVCKLIRHEVHGHVSFGTSGTANGSGLSCFRRFFGLIRRFSSSSQ